jgi:hypothetical protein
MRSQLRNRDGSVLLYVLVVSIVVAVIAAFLSQLFLARYTLGMRQQNSETGRTMSESIYAVLDTAWVPYQLNAQSPSCADACPNIQGWPCAQCGTTPQATVSAGAAGSAMPPNCACQVICNNPEDPLGAPVTVQQKCSPSNSTCQSCELQIVSRPD